MIPAAFLWIYTPIIAAGGIYLLRNRKFLVRITSLVFATVLLLSIRFIPLGVSIPFWGKEFVVLNEFVILGRKLVINQQNLAIIYMIYLVLVFWYGAALFVDLKPDFYPLGFLIAALFATVFSVRPFLFAGLILAIIALLSCLLFDQSDGIVRKGSVRYLSYQMIGMAFLLFAGWGIGLVDPYELDPKQVGMTLAFFGAGILFLLGIFPFNSWIPMIAGRTDAVPAGFFFSFQSGFITLFILYFLSSFGWVADSTIVFVFLRRAGVVMLLTGGIWALFQQNVGRLFGYIVILEIGRSLMALSLHMALVQLFAFSFARLLALGVWALAVSAITCPEKRCNYTDLRGILKTNPLPASALLVAVFTIAGLPLLGEFPFLLSMAGQLVHGHPWGIWALVVASFGTAGAGLQIFRVMLEPAETTNIPPEDAAGFGLKLLVLFGITGIVLCGLFPQWFIALAAGIPGL